MTILTRLNVGRILLHLLAMLGDRCVRFHLDGIVNDLAPIEEIEFEEWDDIDTAVEVELLLGNVQATAFGDR